MALYSLPSKCSAPMIHDYMSESCRSFGWSHNNVVSAQADVGCAFITEPCSFLDRKSFASLNSSETVFVLNRWDLFQYLLPVVRSLSNLWHNSSINMSSTKAFMLLLETVNYYKNNYVIFISENQQAYPTTSVKK